MSDKMLKRIKFIALGLVLISLIIVGQKFYNYRQYKEKVVAGPGVTNVTKLGDYFEPIKDTVNDCNIYILDSGNPGGTAMVIGGAHPEEPAANISAQLLVENVVPKKGKLIVAIWSNRSASLNTRPGEAYPMYYHVKTEWGEKKFRMGSRWSSPLDSWPDPEVYIHYPSKQMLSYKDIRNANRTWPGKKDGGITEQTCYAFTELIEKEKVDLFIDLHEAELEYSVINTIVAHESARDVASMSSMILTADQFEVPISMEYSPKTLHGLSHREVGDHTRAASLLFETAEPMLDRVRGVTDEELLMRGKDEFVRKAGDYGLLYSPIDKEGWPIERRVGRHNSTLVEVAKQWSMLNPTKAIELSNVPQYNELIKNGVGPYFKNPAEVEEDRVYLE